MITTDFVEGSWRPRQGILEVSSLPFLEEVRKLRVHQYKYEKAHRQKVNGFVLSDHEGFCRRKLKTEAGHL